MPRSSARSRSATPVWFGRLGLELRRLASPLLVSTRGLLSITFEIPLDPLPVPGEALQPWCFWERPADDHRLLGLGEALRLSKRGDGRFTRLRQCVAEREAGWIHIEQGQARCQARAFLGFAFDPVDPGEGPWESFPNLLWIVPSLLLEWRRGCCSLTFSQDCARREAPARVIDRWMRLLLRLLETSDGAATAAPRLLEMREEPSGTAWSRDVAEAVAAIRDDSFLHKVVLSRTQRLRFDGVPDSATLLDRLAGDFSGCTILGVRLGQATLLAATPERLLSMAGGEVCSDAIAGTLPADGWPEGEGMRHHEHRPVVEAVCAALGRWCDTVEAEVQPTTLSLPGLAHLATPVRGRLSPEADVHDLLEALHPTPAVGGVPRQAAMAWIRAHERHARGWYTGGFGWVGDGDRAELAVVLRSGLLRGTQLMLHAGAGITRISRPANELAETELKLRTLRDRLLS